METDTIQKYVRLQNGYVTTVDIFASLILHSALTLPTGKQPGMHLAPYDVTLRKPERI